MQKRHFPSVVEKSRGPELEEAHSCTLDLHCEGLFILLAVYRRRKRKRNRKQFGFAKCLLKDGGKWLLNMYVKLKLLFVNHPPPIITLLSRLFTRFPCVASQVERTLHPYSRCTTAPRQNDILESTRYVKVKYIEGQKNKLAIIRGPDWFNVY